MNDVVGHREDSVVAAAGKEGHGHTHGQGWAEGERHQAGQAGGGDDDRGERDSKECVSREMFVIGGAGTDPIRVRLWSKRGGGELLRYEQRRRLYNDITLYL